MKKMTAALLGFFVILSAVLGVFFALSATDGKKYRAAVYERAYTQACEASEGLSLALAAATKDFLPSDVSSVGKYASRFSEKLSELSLDTERCAPLLRYLALVCEISDNSLRLLDLGEKSEYYRDLFGRFAPYAKRAEEEFLPSLGGGGEYEILEDIFADLGDIYYDGVYSDEEREGLFSLLLCSPILDIGEVTGTAERFFGKNAKLETSFSPSFPPFYNFYCDNVSLDVSQMGGFVLRFLYDRRDAPRECTAEEAKQKMYEFLGELGLDGLVLTEFSDDGDYFAVFSPEEETPAGKILCLSEGIKICVGRAGGKVSAFDATSYYKYHKTERDVPRVKVPEGASLAYIVAASGRETLCYILDGVFCNAENGRRETKIE